MSRIAKIIVFAWLSCCVIVLIYTLANMDNDKNKDLSIVFVYFMTALSFPSGVLVGFIWGAASEIKYYVFCQYFDDSGLILFTAWMMYLAFGYMQWFVLIPRLMRWLFSKLRRS